MIELYYDTEAPLPLDVSALCRKVVARTEEEKSAVIALLDEYFTETPEGWRNLRCDEDIAVAEVKMVEEDARKENERERQRRHRERRAELFARLREFDDVPAYDTKTETLQKLLDTHLSRVTSQVHTQDATANHNPEPITHNPISKNIVADAPAGDAVPDVVELKKKAEPKFDAKAALIADGVDEQQAADFLQIRKAKKAPLTLTALDGIKAEAAKAGMTLASAVAVCCVRGWQGFKADWILGDQRGRQQAGKPSAYQVAHIDHAATDRLMAEDNARRGMVVLDDASLEF